MPSIRHARGPLRRALVLVAAAASIAIAIAGRPAPARAGDPAALSSRLAATQAAEQSLRSAVAADNAHIGAYQGSINVLQAKLSTIDAQVTESVARLVSIRAQERAEQARLSALEAQLAATERALAANLVSSYEQPPPDALTVVLNAHGFNDLLERLDFLRRVKAENALVITSDRAARQRVIAEAERLGALEAQQERETRAMYAARRTADTLRLALVDRQAVYVRARDRRSGALASVAARRRHLQAELAAVEAAQAQAATSAAGGGSGPSGAGAPASSSANGFTFPLPTSAAVGPGSWSQDQGVDIAAPGDTPEYAVGSGTIVLHGIGGFGPWAPVLHLDTPIDGQSFVYYGHAGPLYQLPVGSHVDAGQVMSSIGPGIVGLSSGPHVEIGFADASGTPAPGTSGLMLSLLQGSYH